MRVAAEDDMSKMTFSHPAKKWHEALPIGDGRTAVMVYGKRGGEKLDFNDATLWSGYPKDHDNAAAKGALSRAREAAFAGKYAQANAIVQGEMYGDYTEAYMPLASVKMSISGERMQKYRRTLDLDNGEVVVEDRLVVRAVPPAGDALRNQMARAVAEARAYLLPVRERIAEVREGVVYAVGEVVERVEEGAVQIKNNSRVLHTLEHTAFSPACQC